MGNSFPLLQGPAPDYEITFAVAAVFFVATLALYCRRVQRLKSKFGPDAFHGPLRTASLISAYIDDHEAWGYAVLRICTKSILFLGGLQLNFHWGYVAMFVFLMLESSLDSIRILLAYRHCRSLGKVQAIHDGEAKGLKDVTKFEPTNVYEDMTRPVWIAGMVFGLQVGDRAQLSFFRCFLPSI